MLMDYEDVVVFYGVEEEVEEVGVIDVEGVEEGVVVGVDEGFEVF